MEHWREEQNKKYEFINKLRTEGHGCIVIAESHPIQVEWCKQKQCMTPQTTDDCRCVLL